MKHIEILSGFRVFKGCSQVSTTRQLANGKLQVIKIDYTQPINKQRCLDIINKCESRTGESLDRLVITVSFWEYENRDEYFKAKEADKTCGGWATSELNPFNILKDTYEYDKSTDTLDLVRYANLTPLQYHWVDSKGFVEIDSRCNPVGEVINPQLFYTNPNTFGSEDILKKHKTSIKQDSSSGVWDKDYTTRILDFDLNNL